MDVFPIGAVFAVGLAVWVSYKEYKELLRRAEQVKEFGQKARHVLEDVVPPTDSAAGTVLREPALTGANAELVRAFESLIQKEGKRNFWSGLAQNTVFFVLGIIATVLMK